MPKELANFFSTYAIVVAKAIAGILWVVCIGMQPSYAQTLDAPAAVADGSLWDCHVLSIDRAIAVGDKGLVLATTNGGRHWAVKRPKSVETYYGVEFENETHGVIVGGTIEPVTRRSTGTVLISTDGGENWEKTRTPLPRLKGVKIVRSGHWIAWGDWSAVLQSSVFETRNGGSSWQPIQVPCGHVETIGLFNDSTEPQNRLLSSSQPSQSVGAIVPPQAIIIDRLGKGHVTYNWNEYRPLALPISPFQKINFCVCVDGTWWVGGDGGFLCKSTDGQNWEHAFVPGQAQDRDLMSFHSVTGAGSSLWLVGGPGSVVWHSADSGVNWRVVSSTQRNLLRGVHALDRSVVIACGEGGSIVQSRNSGSVWSLVHQSVSRVAALNIASTVENIAWDALCFTHYDAKLSSAAIVVHDQSIEQRSSGLPESSECFAEAGQQLGLAGASAWRSQPVVSGRGVPREMDLNFYNGLGPIHDSPQSLFVRRLILALRTYQPDVLITDCPQTHTELQRRLSEAVEMATTWSGRRDFELFSAESGIPNDNWSVGRLLYRGTRSGGLHFPKSMLLQSSGVVIGEVMAPLVNLTTPYQVESFPEPKKRVYYRTIGARQSNLKDPFESIQRTTSVQLKERSNGANRTSTILQTSSWFETQRFVPDTNFNPLVRDRAWEERLLAAMRGVEFGARVPVLYEIAIQNRIKGNWNYWAASLELLLAETPSSSYHEAAFLELMQYHGSVEVHRMMSSQLGEMERRNDASGGTVPISITSSPFSQPGDTYSGEASMVQQASFTHSPIRIPLTVSQGLPEFHRLLGKLPADQTWKRQEHAMGWLVSSRYRSLKGTGASATAVDVPYDRLWPLQAMPLLEWKQVFLQEQSTLRFLTTRQTSANSPSTRSQDNSKIDVIGLANERPYLDGKGDEEFWLGAKRISMRDPWGMDAGQTTLAMAHDSEFLYLLSEVTGAAGKGTKGTTAERAYDAVRPEHEQVRFRIDLDRDYATWFEFAWNRAGATSDSFNDIASWNPKWYIAVQETGEGWTAEIAIPKSELLVQGSDGSSPMQRELGMDIWAINAIHLQPGHSSRSISPAVSDRFQHDQWTLVRAAE